MKNKQQSKSRVRRQERKARKQSTPNRPITFWGQNRLPILALFGLAIGLYIMTVSFDYALDDRLYIIGNQHTVKGVAGIPDIVSKESLHGFFGTNKDHLVAGGRYRPLPIVTYALEYQLFGAKPGMSHFFNLILYGLTAILLFRLLCYMLPPDKNGVWYLSLPFMATALYVAHPLHTEVVANIKGRVEMMCLLGALSALYFMFKYLDTKRLAYLLVAAFAFLLALLSKESAITFLAVIPLSIYFFTKHNAKNILLAMLPILGATFLFLFIRYQVLGYLFSSGIAVTELLNNPFVNASFAEKYATIFYTLGLYLKLLVFPFPLTHDYYPTQIPIINWVDVRAILPLLLYVGMGIYALIGLFNKHVVAYGIAIFLATFSIVSNVFFPIGTFMNERFMYIPSIGFCLILAYAMAKYLPRLGQESKPNFKLLQNIFLLLLFGYCGLTLARVPAWKSNETLFLTDVKTSSNSTKANTSAGGILLETLPSDPSKRVAQTKQAISYLKKALKIYPDNNNALSLLGNAYLENKEYDKMFEPFDILLASNPQRGDVHRNLSFLSETTESTEVADKLIRFYEEKVLPLEPQTAVPYDALGVLYGKKKNDLARSITFFNKALTFPDFDGGTYQDLAIAYGMQGDFEKSLETSRKALDYHRSNMKLKAKVFLNMAITYQNMGNQEEAKKHFEQAFSLDPSLQQ